MDETTSVYWVDLGYWLRSRKRIPLQGSRGMTDTPSCCCSCSCYTCYTCYLTCYSCYLTTLR